MAAAPVRKTLCGIITDDFEQSKMTGVLRQIRFYQKYGDRLIGEISLNSIDIQELTKILKDVRIDNDPFLYNCYLLDNNMILNISHLTKQTFQTDFDKYEYYLEATAKDDK
jgi:hypothetical protein